MGKRKGIYEDSLTLVIVETVEAEALTGDAAKESFFSDHCEISSMGKGKIIVEFFSALMELRVWR